MSIKYKPIYTASKLSTRFLTRPSKMPSPVSHAYKTIQPIFTTARSKLSYQETSIFFSFFLQTGNINKLPPRSNHFCIIKQPLISHTTMFLLSNTPNQSLPQYQISGPKVVPDHTHIKPQAIAKCKPNILTKPHHDLSEPHITFLLTDTILKLKTSPQ